MKPNPDTQSNKTLSLEQIVDTLQLRSFDIAINEPDNYMKGLKEYKAEAIATLTTRDNRMVQEARIDELQRIDVPHNEAWQIFIGDRIATLTNQPNGSKE